MVCVPCIVIPVLLWVWHKFIQPYVIKFWNPWGLFGKSKSVVENGAGPPKDFDTSTKEYKYIQETTEKYPVVMFSKTTCKFCTMARDLFKEVGVDYHEEMIGDREDCQAVQDVFKEVTGERTVPRIYIGGKCIGGGSDTWTLHNQGKLVPDMEKAGASFSNGKKKEN